MSASPGARARSDGRAPGELRPVTIDVGVQAHAEGSALISFGKTQVLCAASVETHVPRWRQASGLGWVTAEYAMLPRATTERTPRESTRGKVGGRTHEIQRLIGRSLRSVTDLKALADRSVLIDCDVLQADGGTRTAAITGAWVALSRALDEMTRRGMVRRRPRLDPLAAISVGIVDDEILLDLCYSEDVRAQVDMNVVMAGDGKFVEVQGTAEGAPFERAQMDAMVDLAAEGCRRLFDIQASVTAA